MRTRQGTEDGEAKSVKTANIGSFCSNVDMTVVVDIDHDSELMMVPFYFANGTKTHMPLVVSCQSNQLTL